MAETPRKVTAEYRKRAQRVCRVCFTWKVPKHVRNEQGFEGVSKHTKMEETSFSAQPTVTQVSISGLKLGSRSGCTSAILTAIVFFHILI